MSEVKDSIRHGLLLKELELEALLSSEAELSMNLAAERLVICAGEILE